MTQAAIFELDHPHTYHLEYKRRTGSDLSSCRHAIHALVAMRTEFPSLVLGFGFDLWSELAPNSIPRDFRSFDPLESPAGFSAPSTQGDLFIWLHGPLFDPLFDLALTVQRILREHFELSHEAHGFVRSESRDLTGFIDGSANPTGEDARAAALIPAGSVGARGSFVLTQKWTHDLDKFGALDIAAQEQVFGRTKPDSIEFEGDAMPENSHVGRTDVKVDGVGQKLLRQSTPIGTVAEHGLYFLAFSCELSRFDVLLRRMFGLSEDGIHDRLIEFSEAQTGAYWFAPAEDQLSEVFG